MIHRIVKKYIFLIVMFSDFLMFADDDPGTGFEDEDGDVGGSVEDIAPINTKLIWLAMIGVAFAYYYFRKHNSTLNDNKLNRRVS